MSEEFDTYEGASKQEYVDGVWKELSCTFRVAKTPFARGGLRAAFHAYLDGNETRTLVAKRFLKEDEETQEGYRRDVRTQSVAHSLGVQYNSYNPPKQVDFLPAFLVVVSGGATFLCEEKLPEGTFVKHNDNAGFVASLEARNTPQAFSHFSWIQSNRTLLIADVQGVGDHYTDPGIHSVDRSFGFTDLGVFGVAFFFSSHECNEICRSLGLPKFDLPVEGKITVDSPVMRKQKTIPILTRHLTQRKVDTVITTPATRLKGCAHLGLELPKEEVVPVSSNSTADVHLALANLHESGRLVMLHAALEAAAQGKDTIPDLQETPNREAAMFHYQVSAFAGNTEAMMIMAMIHAGFLPRDFCSDLEFTDPRRAIFFLKLAAARKNRSAALHLGDMNFAQGQLQEALNFYESASKMPVAGGTTTDEEKDTLGLLNTELPRNVWANIISNANLYARIAEVYEKLGQNASASEWYSSASEEAFADPLMAKKAMQWSEKAASLE